MTYDVGRPRVRAGPRGRMIGMNFAHGTFQDGDAIRDKYAHTACRRQATRRAMAFERGAARLF